MFLPLLKRRRHHDSSQHTQVATTGVRVERVQLSPGEPTVAVWVFSDAIADPGRAVDGLVVNGRPGLSWDRDDVAAIRVDYGFPIVVGLPWACAAGAGGIVAETGQTLVAGKGAVLPGCDCPSSRLRG